MTVITDGDIIPAIRNKVIVIKVYKAILRYITIAKTSNINNRIPTLAVIRVWN